MTQAHGFAGLQHRINNKNSGSPDPNSGGAFFKLGKNPNNPYQSYYFGGKKISHFKGVSAVPI